MGVAGSGKTTVGSALAAALGWRFVDADDHHSRREHREDGARRAARMMAYCWPWLDRLRAIIDDALRAKGTS